MRQRAATARRDVRRWRRRRASTSASTRRDRVGDRQARGVEVDGVGGHRQRRRGAAAIGWRRARSSAVATAATLKLPRLVRRIVGAAPGALGRIGVEVDLDRRLGEDDGADVAAFHHQVAVAGHRALLRRPGWRAPPARRATHRRGAIDHRRADGGGHVDAVDGDARRVDLDAGAIGQRRRRPPRRRAGRRARPPAQATARYIAPVSTCR